METAKTHQQPAIRCGTVEIVQKDTDHMLIRHHGKRQIVEVCVEAKILEKWAVRQLRALVFENG